MGVWGKRKREGKEEEGKGKEDIIICVLPSLYTLLLIL
jgi:hypothetical protein